jgi:hypothetical protein
MEMLLSLLVEAVFQWQQVKGGTLFIGYPSKGTVLEVCSDETYCFPPTNKMGDVVHRETPVKVISILVEEGGNRYRDYLVWDAPAKG